MLENSNTESISSVEKNCRATTTLYRPVGEKELALIIANAYLAFPPRLFWQPIFYPVLNEEYARQIAHDWNARDHQSGYVTRFRVETDFLFQYEIQKVGSSIHQEYWIPAKELELFNRHLCGKIEVIAEYHS